MQGKQPQPDDNDDQHAIVVADTEQKLEIGIARVNSIVFSDEMTKENIRKEQLKIHSEINQMNTGLSLNQYHNSQQNTTLISDPHKDDYILPIPEGCTGLVIGK